MDLNGIVSICHDACDDSKSIESNRIASYRFDQGDVELIGHDAL